MNVPENLKYAESHEWVLVDGEIATVGISDHAQEELTDIVYAELPDAGRSVAAGEAVAVVESVKAASDIYSPVNGEVVETNKALGNDPALLNTDPYGNGWLFKVRLTDPSGLDQLKDAASYTAQIS